MEDVERSQRARAFDAAWYARKQRVEEMLRAAEKKAWARFSYTASCSNDLSVTMSVVSATNSYPTPVHRWDRVPTQQDVSRVIRDFEKEVGAE